MTRWSIAATVVVLVCLAGPTRPAGADRSRDSADATQDSQGNPIVTVRTDGDVHLPEGRRGSGSVVCGWFELEVEYQPIEFREEWQGPPAQELVEDAFYYLLCTAGDGTEVRREIRQWTPADAAAMARELAIEAAAELAVPYPRPAMSPAIEGEQLVGFPSWLWVDPTSWQTVTATASIPGLTATAIATPVRTRWDMGDDTDEIVCEGPGTPYDPTVDDDAQSTDCEHIFQRASVTTDDPAGAYETTVYIDWDISWTADNGESGALDATTRGTTFSLQVTERQAIVCHGTLDQCPHLDE